VAGGRRAERRRTSSTIDYAVKLIGVDHVGISSDFDGGGGSMDGTARRNFQRDAGDGAARLQEQIGNLERQSSARVGEVRKWQTLQGQAVIGHVGKGRTGGRPAGQKRLRLPSRTCESGEVS
jgi:hypothetical protein